MSYIGPHTFNQGAWHNCMRCDEKTKLHILQWQRGLLLCPRCYDTGTFPLEGQREIAIDEVLTDGKYDFQIDPKLQDPIVDTDDMILF
jgi:hypothetical protein